MTIGSLRDYWLQVDAPSAEDVVVPEQFMAVRKALGSALAFDPLHTVLLPPGGTMSFIVKRRSTDYSIGVTAAVTYRTTGINGLAALLMAAGVDPSIAKSSKGLDLLFDCGGPYFEQYIENKNIIDPDKFGELVLCTGLGGLGNLSVPEKAIGAVRSHYGLGLDANDSKIQGEFYARAAPKLQVAGIAMRAAAGILAARDAVITSLVPLSDAIQNLALQGDAFAITLSVKAVTRAKPRPTAAGLTALQVATSLPSDEFAGFRRSTSLDKTQETIGGTTVTNWHTRYGGPNPAEMLVVDVTKTDDVDAVIAETKQRMSYSMLTLGDAECFTDWDEYTSCSIRLRDGLVTFSGVRRSERELANFASRAAAGSS